MDIPEDTSTIALMHEGKVAVHILKYQSMSENVVEAKEQFNFISIYQKEQIQGLVA